MAEKIIIHDIATNQIIEREPNKDELDQIAKVRADFNKHREAIEARIQSRQSALAKLAALGLTEDEIAAL